MYSGLVSVVIPSYNRYGLLQCAITSILNQSYKFLEIIVVNDCSTDPQYYTADAFPYDDRVKVIHLAQNSRDMYKFDNAQGMTRNVGIDLAKGEWIAFLDDDDHWCDANKIQRQMQELEAAGMQFCCTNMYTREGVHLKGIPRIIDAHVLRFHNPIMQSTVLIHKSLLQSVSGFQLKHQEDYDCWKRITSQCNCSALYISEPTTWYHLDSIKHYK